MFPMSHVKKSVLTAICIALCIVLPMAFHMIPNAGSIFCPMHIPVLLCGLICGPISGLLCGLIAPFLSSVFTQMPPFAILPSMMVELAIYGLFSGLTLRLVHTGRLYRDLYISLISALLAGRILGGIAKALIFAAGEYSVTAWATGYFITCLPGIIIQLALIPPIVAALEKASLFPVRYPEKSTEPCIGATCDAKQPE